MDDLWQRLERDRETKGYGCEDSMVERVFERRSKKVVVGVMPGMHP